MSDRIAVLNEGYIQQVGSPEALYERPQNLFVARFMGHSNLFPIREHSDAGIHTDLGWIDGAFDVGSHVLIRPEIVTLSAGQSHSADGLAATVGECIYRGSVAEYRLRCGDTELIAKCSNLGQGMFAVGEQVTVNIETGGLVTLHE